MVRWQVGVLLMALAVPTLAAQSYGIDARAANATLLIDELPPAAPGAMHFEQVYTQLTFTQPLFLSESPDGTGRLFVVEKTGRIRVFPKAGDPAPGDVTTFLDISSRVTTYSEQGLLGLAFDPEFKSNGVFYVYYSNKVSPNIGDPGVSRVSRFVASPSSANTVSTATEQVILEIAQPYPNHNGGMVAFGPDGMFYISLGDGGSGGDPQGNGQNTATLLGSILRIDVRGAPDPGLAYAIPPGNPFYSGGPAGAATRKEIWAYGLRNPWRFSFDRENGRLICGDVGQVTYEEVDVIEPGNNYGWKIMEGMHCYPPPGSGCDQTGLTLPIVEYDHSVGNSITGGYVYYGRATPELYGMYVYADYGSGRVWGLRHDEGAWEGPFNLVGANARSVSSWGQDADGEIYATDIADGRLYVLRPDVAVAGDFPQRLSDIPALLAAGLGQDQTGQGILPFAPIVQLWSDGTLKERFMALPGLAQATWRLEDGWEFPERTILIKNFLLPADERQTTGPLRRIETRLLYRRSNQWNGFSYEWNDAQTDAQLLAGGKFKNYTITNRDGQPENFNYLFPSREQCLQCHTAPSGGVLGLQTPAMNAPFRYPASGVTDNQLRTLDHIGLFDGPLPDSPANLPAMPDAFDAGARVGDRARAYLAVNCAMCHRPGVTPAELDLRWSTADADMHALYAAPLLGDLGIAGARIIAPGRPDRSILLVRDSRRDGLTQMPPLGTSRPHAAGLDLIGQWIMEMSVSGVRDPQWVHYR
jgi:uncharacterized repeat protein (TIGR03806 family)